MTYLDIVMANVGGGETYDKLKEINPEVKVLVLSGCNVDVKADDILDRGFKKRATRKGRRLLTKPSKLKSPQLPGLAW